MKTGQSAPGNIAVLGSTGSIGVSTLDVVRRNPSQFRVVSLSAHSQVERIVEQAQEFKPALVALASEEAAELARRELGSGFTVIGGEDAAEQAALHPAVHSVVAAVVGFAGLRSVLAAIEGGKHVALANKESLVAGGAVVRAALEQNPSVQLVPVDSEHNSLFQCLRARREGDELRRITITASGGPFLDTPREKLASVTWKEAVKHPRWDMGAKISVDSATMMNKGLEVIEASWLFSLPPEKINVLVHPQSVVHGLIEFSDGAVIASLAETDMRVPISFALGALLAEGAACGPRVSNGVPFLDLAKVGALEFREADFDKFPLLQVAYRALELGGGAGAVLNAANEIAVKAFLDEEIGFLDVSEIVIRTMDAYNVSSSTSYEDVALADAWGRERASNLLERL